MTRTPHKDKPVFTQGEILLKRLPKVRTGRISPPVGCPKILDNGQVTAVTLKRTVRPWDKDLSSSFVFSINKIRFLCKSTWQFTCWNSPLYILFIVSFGLSLGCYSFPFGESIQRYHLHYVTGSARARMLFQNQRPWSWYPSCLNCLLVSSANRLCSDGWKLLPYWLSFAERIFTMQATKGNGARYVLVAQKDGGEGVNVR